MIQVCIQHPDLSKPEVLILHRSGYEYDTEALKAKYTDVLIQFHAFAEERTMVDTFWQTIMDLKGMVVFTGFNAVHATVFNQGGRDTNPTDKGYKNRPSYNVFYGYDLNWLTHRTSFKFTPRSAPFKLAADRQAMAS